MGRVEINNSLADIEMSGTEQRHMRWHDFPVN